MQASGNNSSRRGGVTRTNGVVAGSVWETRMKLDQVKGGIKVFKGEESRDDHDDGGGGNNGVDDEVGGGLRVYSVQRLRRNQSGGASAAAEKRKRRYWRPLEATDSSPIQLRKTRSESSKSPRISDENCREFGGGGKTLARSLSNAGGFGGKGLLPIGGGCEGEDGGGDDGEEIEVETERNSFDDKEVDLPGEKKPENMGEEKKINPILEIPISSNADEQMLDEMDHPAIDPDIMKPPPPRAVNPDLAKPPPRPVDPDLAKPPHRTIDPEPAKPPPVEVAEEFYESMPETQHRMQNIVDLVMWRDISRSAFVFGIGTFLLLSSSYTKDLNFSLISAVSYLGLVYLAAIFLYKSILHRGVVEFEETNQRCMLGEEEAIWLLKLLLPYINELLVKLKALFSGDPSTTMKLALVLFVLARCGDSITIWTMAKLAFFGVFTIPKVCSSYSVQLARYGKFWLERIRDAWESCQHKKAAAAAIFTVVWNLSSTVARIWAVFMLIVAVRFYHQRVMTVEEWDMPEEQQEAVPEDSKQVARGGRGGGGQVVQQAGTCRGHRHRGGPVQAVAATREKKKWS